MTEPNPSVLTYRPRRVRRYRRRTTEADRTALRENLYKTTIAKKGLVDSPEVRYLYESCPEAFFDWAFRDGRIVPNEITSTQLKLIVAVLRAQRTVTNAAQAANNIPTARAKKSPGRPAS